VVVARRRLGWVVREVAGRREVRMGGAGGSATVGWEDESADGEDGGVDGWGRGVLRKEAGRQEVRMGDVAGDALGGGMVRLLVDDIEGQTPPCVQLSGEVHVEQIE
jgi:hypothetical protein